MFNSSGSIIWSKTYSYSSDSVRFYSIRNLPDSFILAGKAGNRVILVKTDSSGNLVWGKSFSISPSEGLKVIPINGIFVFGNYNGKALAIKADSSGRYNPISLNSINATMSSNTFSLTPTSVTVIASNDPLSPSSSYINIDSVDRPRVVFTQPDSGEVDVPLSANIGVWFSKDIDTTSVSSGVSISGWDGSSFRSYTFSTTCPASNFCVLDPILNFRPNEEITVRRL